ncbi:protein of unknown function [Pseudomonas sp. JV241A]|nr:protein of unknown function [Pseudomonas sp. JV241A]
MYAQLTLWEPVLPAMFFLVSMRNKVIFGYMYRAVHALASLPEYLAPV